MTKICDYCGEIITREDDYAGLYVSTNYHDEDFHYECFEERARNHITKIVKELENGK